MWVVLLLLFRWLLVPLCRSPSRKHKGATPSITPGCSLPEATPQAHSFLLETVSQTRRSRTSGT